MEISSLVPPDTNAFGSAARPRLFGRPLGGPQDPPPAAPSPPRAVGGGPESAERGLWKLALCDGRGEKGFGTALTLGPC